MNSPTLHHPNELGTQAKRVSPVWALLLLIALQLPLPSMLIHGSSLGVLAAREGVFWVTTLIIIAFVLLFERRPLTSIGLRPPSWRSVGWGLAGAIAAVVGIALIYMVLVPALGLPSDDRQTESIVALPLWFRCLLITRAAIFEEMLYRGFAIERITEVTHLRWAAAGMSLAAYTFAHLSYWGWSHLLVAGFGGLVLTILYVWRRDLIANMIAHFQRTRLVSCSARNCSSAALVARDLRRVDAVRHMHGHEFSPAILMLWRTRCD